MSDTPDLFAYAMQNLVYDGRSGSVLASDTSRERAELEDSNGTTANRANDVLETLKLRRDGLTWFELAALLNLHHGQASGCLSMLHKGAQVFALRKKRGKCHPYVHIAYRNLYPASERLDEPVKTKATIEREALAGLLIAVDNLLQSQTWDTITSLRVARATYQTNQSNDDI